MPTLRPALVPFLLSAIAALVCALAAGASLGLFLGPLLLDSILLPPLLLRHDPPTAQEFRSWTRVAPLLLTLGGVIDGTGLIWFLAAFVSSLSFTPWLLCYLLLACYVSALAALVLWLRRLRLAPVGASAVAVVGAIAYLTWPIYLAPWLTRIPTLVGWLIPIHPLFALNSILATPFGIWTHQPIAYRLTTLGQDLPYTLPATIAPAAVFHLILAVVLLLLPPRRRRASDPAPSSSFGLRH